MNNAIQELINSGRWQDIDAAEKRSEWIMGERFDCVPYVMSWMDLRSLGRGYYGWIPMGENVPRALEPTHSRPLPDDRLADALAVAVEALDIIQRRAVTLDMTRWRAEQALTKIQRIAEGKDDD